MKKRNLIIGALISIIVLIALGVLLFKLRDKLIKKQNQVVQNAIKQEQEEEMFFVLDNPQVEEDPIYEKDAADYTRDIQSMNENIGTINIPKTGLVSEVYCRQDPNKMEEMPCMMYTNIGPNKPGVTIIVGHNRENGTIFSNNNQLEENDEIYFKDYEGNEKKYIVYSKFVTDSMDVSFYNTPSDVPILAMQCCLTANSTDKVLIVMAKVEE